MDLKKFNIIGGVLGTISLLTFINLITASAYEKVVLVMSIYVVVSIIVRILVEQKLYFVVKSWTLLKEVPITEVFKLEGYRIIKYKVGREPLLFNFGTILFPPLALFPVETLVEVDEVDVGNVNLEVHDTLEEIYTMYKKPVVVTEEDKFNDNYYNKFKQ